MYGVASIVFVDLYCLSEIIVAKKKKNVVVRACPERTARYSSGLDGLLGSRRAIETSEISGDGVMLGSR